MAKSIKAFPNSSPFNSKEDGMDLRDYFAAMAMQAHYNSDRHESIKIISSFSYEMADAMMEARSK